MELLNWVKKDNLSWFYLSKNSNAIEMLYENIDLINWFMFSQNENPLAIELIEKTINNIQSFYHLSSNPIAFEYLKTHPEFIDWSGMIHNPTPEAFEYVISNNTNIKWYEFLENPCAIDIIMNELENEYINSFEYDKFIHRLSFNPHPIALEYLQNHPNKINWWGLSQNPTAITYLLEIKIK